MLYTFVHAALAVIAVARCSSVAKRINRTQCLVSILARKMAINTDTTRIDAIFYSKTYKMVRKCKENICYRKKVRHK